MPIFRGKQFASAESDYKDSVRVVQRTNINFNTLIYTVDNISLEHANRVLLVGQTTSSQNGIYSWNFSTKKLTRATDADSSKEISAGLKVYVEEGDVNANTTWVLVSPGIITLGVSDLTFIRENRLGSLDIAGTYGSGSKSAVITIDEYGDISQIIEQPISISGLPSQTGNSGKYLKTDGSSASWETASTTLAGLSDVDTSNVSDNYFLTYDSNSSTWVAEQGIADGTVIDGGNLDGASSGSGITNIAEVHNLADLSDVSISNLVTNQVLKFNGTNWINSTLSASGGSNSYNDLTDKPNFATVATSGSYTDLINKPSLFSGSYTDLTNKPTIPSVPTTVSSFTNDAGYLTSVGTINYSDLTNKPTLFSGDYADLTGKPSIPDAQVQSDWTSTSGISQILNKPSLSTVATSGSYSDLTDKPTLFSGSYTDLTDKPSLATVATSGSYNDLTDKPSSSSNSSNNQYTLTGTTTNATETEIFVEGVSNSRIDVSVNTTVYYNIDMVARRTDTPGDHAAFYIKGVANNNAGTTSDIGSLYEVIVARTDAGLSVDVRADNTTDTINIYVTGVANKTFSWKCVLTKIEV